MKIDGWIHVLLGLLAIGSGAIVLHGVLKVKLSGNRVVRFLRYSLIASVAGLLPLTPHLSPIQGICMLSVYCAGAAVLAWRKFRLAGLWRTVFSLSIVAVLYLNVVSVSIRLFEHSVLFAKVSMESGPPFEVAQFLFASVFAVLGVLAVSKCHTQQTHSF
jgi:hypothetical protein